MIGGSPWTRRLLATVGILGLVFLTVPILIVIPMSFSSAKALTFPPPSFSLRWYQTFFGDPRWMDAMWTSTFVALIASVAALLLGGLAAYGLRRGSFAGRDWAEGNFMAPLIVPTIIVAIALYLGLAFAGVVVLRAFGDAPAPASLATASPLVEPLSARERDVLRLLASGRTNQELADDLSVAVTTAKKHLSNLIGKLGVRNRTEAIARARELHLL